MRLSSLCVAAVLLFSSISFAQHSSGAGGSSGGGSASGGGGGSHGGSSGGSSSSASSGGSHTSGGGSASGSSTHSSGGSGSGSSTHTTSGAASHVSSVHSPGSAPTSSRSSVIDSHTNRVQNNHAQSDHVQNNVRSIREPNTGLRDKAPTSEKRSFFSFLRHPFRKPMPNPPLKTQPVADLRRPVCYRGPCTPCPNGQPSGGGCAAAIVPTPTHPYCTFGEIWSGGACLLQTRFLDDCAVLRMTMQRQEQRMRLAESQQQNACAAGSSQACMDSTSAAQSEAGFYRTLQARYRLCMQQSASTYPFAGFGLGSGRGLGFGSYSSGLLFDPLELQFNYP